MCDEGQSLARKGVAALPQTLAAVHVFAPVLCGCVVKDLRRRFEPPEPRGERQQSPPQQVGGGIEGDRTVYRSATDT